MNDVKIVKNFAGKIELYSPYDPSTPKRAKNIGGKWNAHNRCWTFDARDYDRVKQLASDVYGWTEEAEEKITFQFTITESNFDEIPGTDNCIQIKGRTIATRWSRDEPVRLADNAIIVSGSFPASGGSRNNPSLIRYDKNIGEIVLEVRDMPKAAIDELKDIKDINLTIIDKAIDPNELLKEKKRLQNRIAEIDRMLESLPKVIEIELDADEDDSSPN